MYVCTHLSGDVDSVPSSLHFFASFLGFSAGLFVYETFSYWVRRTVLSGIRYGVALKYSIIQAADHIDWLFGVLWCTSCVYTYTSIYACASECPCLFSTDSHGSACTRIMAERVFVCIIMCLR